jgi:hypothetical protein
MKTTKSIRYIDWAKDVVDNSNASWILPQVLAALGNYWPISRGENGLYSFSQTLRAWKDLMSRGELDLDGAPISQEGCTKLLNWLCVNPRGTLLGALKQTSGEGVRYSAPVPLILSSWKQYRDVKYSSWDWSDPARRFFLDHDILDWSGYFGAVQPWTPEELCGFRVKALEVKSGAKAGTVRKPETCSSVFGVTDPEFKTLPRLMKLSLTQLWCFHPALRTDLMITDHMNLDSHPEPLVDGEVLTPKFKACTTPTSDQSSPWDMV